MHGVICAAAAVATTPVPWLPENIGLLTFFALVGFFGGGIQEASKGSLRSPVANILTNAFVGAFAAFMAGAGCLAMWGTDHVYVSLLVSGMSGWLGTLALNRLAVWLTSMADARFPVSPPLPPLPSAASGASSATLPTLPPAPPPGSLPPPSSKGPPS
jgi:hypothetical protein